MIKTQFFALVVSLSFLIAAPLQAETWDTMCEKDFPPYNFIDENGNKTGLDTEIVKAVMKQIKIELTIKNAPWKRVVSYVDNNKVSFAYQFMGKPERFEKYWMIGPIRNGKTYLAVLKDSPIKDFNSLDDLKGNSIGCVSGYAYSPEFDKSTSLKKDTCKNNILLIKKLVAKRVDVIIIDLNNLSYLSKKQGVYDQIRILPKLIREVPRYVAFPKQQKEKSEIFKKGLEEIKANGTYDKILKNWQ